MIKQKTRIARRLRRNLTDAEKKLWYYLRNRQFKNLKFRRQYPCGFYFLDFYCPEKNLVIEVDGSQHYTKEGRTHDKIREAYLRKRGLKILRYSARDVLLNIDGVLKDIENEVGD